MITAFDAKSSTYGYGNTNDEAQEDLKFNMLRKDINVDPEWVQRREMMHSWCPMPNILHLDGITSVIAANGTLTNTATKKSVALRKEPLAQFVSLYYLLGESIPFADFCITYADTIDTFFSRVAPEVGHLRDLPPIKPGSTAAARDVHYIRDVAFVAEGATTREIVISDYKKIISVEVPLGVSYDAIIAYGFAKLNKRYNGDILV